VALMAGGKRSAPYERKAVAVTPSGRLRVHLGSPGSSVSDFASFQPCADIHRLTSRWIVASESLDVNWSVTPISPQPFLKYSSLHEPSQLAGSVVDDTSVEPGGTAPWTRVSTLRMPPPGSPPGWPQAAAQRANAPITTPRSPERLIEACRSIFGQHAIATERSAPTLVGIGVAHGNPTEYRSPDAPGSSNLNPNSIPAHPGRSYLPP
jgi:hypothetical protein